MKRNARIPIQMTSCLCRVCNDSYIVPCKKDKVGGTVWKPSNYRNLLLTTMEAFDLVDIQKVRHPQLRKYSYVSKALELKSRIDFFLVAQNLTRFVKKSDIYPSATPTCLCRGGTKCLLDQGFGNLTIPY